MCSVNNLELMAETNSLILSLIIDHLVKYGKKNEEFLRKISSDQGQDSAEMVSSDDEISFTQEEADRLNKIFNNTLVLALSDDADCYKSCVRYVTLLKEFLTSCPRYNKLILLDPLKNLYEKLKESAGEVYVGQELLLSISEVKEMLYQ